MGEQKQSFRWAVLILLFFSLFVATLAMQCMPPLFPEIAADIPLTRAQMGTVMGVLTLASLFFAPLGGALCDKLGSRWCLGISALIVAAGSFSRSFAGSVADLIVCMFVMGAGIAMYPANLPKALGSWFPGEDLAKANGICLAGMGIGGALVMATARNILSPAFGGWKGLVAALGGLVLIAALLWVIIYRDREAGGAVSRKKQNVFENFRKVLRVRDIWLVALYYGLTMVALVAVITLLPLTLEERGVEKAGELVGIMMGAVVIFNILGGVLSDRAGKRRPFLVVCAVIFGFSTLGFGTLEGAALLAALFVAGAAMGTIAPILMSVPVEMEGIGTALAGTAVGFVFMLGNTGGFVGPVVAGRLMDNAGSALPGFLFIAGAIFAAAVLIVPLKETGRKRKPGEKPPAHVPEEGFSD